MMGFDNTIVKIETLLFQVEQVGSLSPEEQRVVRAAQEIRNGNSESERHFMKLYQLAKAQRVESLKLPRLEDKSPGERRTILMDQLFHQTFRGVNPINVYRNSRSYFVKANVDLVFHSHLLSKLK